MDFSTEWWQQPDDDTSHKKITLGWNVSTAREKRGRHSQHDVYFTWNYSNCSWRRNALDCAWMQPVQTDRGSWQCCTANMLPSLHSDYIMTNKILQNNGISRNTSSKWGCFVHFDLIKGLEISHLLANRCISLKGEVSLFGIQICLLTFFSFLISLCKSLEMWGCVVGSRRMRIQNTHTG